MRLAFQLMRRERRRHFLRPASSPKKLTCAEEYGSGGAKLGGFIAVIESRTFIRECIRRSVQSAFPLPVLTYSTAVELEQQHLVASPGLIILSWAEDNKGASINALKVLSELAPRIPVIVLAYNNDAELARTAICHGAKGYIPVTMGFEITVEAVRFVLAGGTYVPMDCLLASGGPGDAPSQPPTTGLVTARELAVIRAIQKGKSNKVIAYELNMCRKHRQSSRPQYYEEIECEEPYGGGDQSAIWLERCSSVRK